MVDVALDLNPVCPGARIDLQPPAFIPNSAAVNQRKGIHTKLTWTSRNGTLVLFTDALGYMQTLTRRSCDQLFATRQLRLISAHLVEDALDAVAQSAMLNSVDIRF